MHQPRTEDQCKAKREAAAIVGKQLLFDTVCIRLAPKSSAKQTDKVAAFACKHPEFIRLAPKSSAKPIDTAVAIVGKHSVCMSLAPKSRLCKTKRKQQPSLASTQFASASH